MACRAVPGLGADAPAPRYDLAASDLLPVTRTSGRPCSIPSRRAADDAGALDAALSAAIAAHHGVPADRVVTAVGSSGANFLALASLVRPGDAVLVEDPATRRSRRRRGCSGPR